MVAAASGDGEGVKISWAILVPKAGTSMPYYGLYLVACTILCLESRLVVRFDHGMGSVYSPSMSSPFEVENMDS